MEDARHKTALATVTSRAAGGFTLDRTVFHAADARYHHAQPCDRGHIVADGHKLKIHKVGWDNKGRLIHRTDGPLPTVGAKAQLHLDAPRRELQARAHTLAHLALAAIASAKGECVAQPEVVGGGEIRFAAKLRGSPEDVARRVDALVAARALVEPVWMPRDEAQKRATPQAVEFARVAPDEPTLRMVRIGESALPCDAPLVERTSDVGAVQWAPTLMREGVARMRARVARK